MSWCPVVRGVLLGLLIVAVWDWTDILILLQHCTLTANSTVAAGEVIPDYTVIYSNGLRRVDKRGVSDLKNKAQARQIDVLRRMIPSNPAKFQ